ncbi:amino acid transporter [Cutaneotrichosporon oleaginosum]|uniref:Amino acid transporter n=1 Tax=Cutaneotrichosporon oleaginosum TaxID=879819 RepID=A0A0J1B475_9TREE|nr:amino acid transporter [Cutaneotrichosporon oleaginosum]KLT42444.1 amino acid transporter [Cutaneotrichosporon oleaginosum]
MSPPPPSPEKSKEELEATVAVQGVQLERNFSFLAILGVSFSILNSWTAMSASLPLVLGSGGSIAMVWGLLVSALGTLAMGVSLAEVCHVLPLSGGQYDWSYVLAPDGWKERLSFIAGWNGTAGWVALSAAAPVLGSGFISGLIALWNPEFAMQPWQFFLLFLAIALLAFVLNVFGVRALPAIDRFAGTWSIVGFVVASIVCLACADTFQKPKAVFATFTNVTGWPDGMAFILGLLQSTFGLTAFDAASHLVEEMPRPYIHAPRVMVLAIVLGAATSWVFMIVILFSLQDFDTVLSATTGPLLQIYYQATSSRVGATCLMMFNLVAMVLAGQGILTVSSRLVLTFARDRGLGPASLIAGVHPRLKAPVWCIVFVTVWVTAFGLINLGSSVTTNAILSSSVVFLQISYFIPIAIVFVRGASAFGEHATHAKWSLGRWRRTINGIALAFVVVTTITFCFPPAIPVLSGTTMNWVVVVVALVWLFAGITWAIDGRTQFHGPKALEERLEIARAA